jgi:hypothetical protein
VTYTAETANVLKLETFIKENYHGLVGHRQRENTQDFKQPLVIAYYAVDYVKNAKGKGKKREKSRVHKASLVTLEGSAPAL